MIIAEVSITPLGTQDPSVSRYVKKAAKTLKETGLHTEAGAMSTIIEAETLDEILAAAQKAHQAVIDEGVQRIVTEIKIDHRLDKNATIKTKKQKIN